MFLSGKRTPFGSYGGSLREINPTDLGVSASRAALEAAGVQPGQVDHVIFGSVLHSAADSIYTPRHVGLKVGVPQAVPSLGINRLCGSGFQVIIEAYHQMLAGDTRIALVGGVENMSMTPFALRGARWGQRLGHGQASDVMMEALYDTYAQAPMAITAENLAEKFKISRDDVDAFALRSQKLTDEAQKAGRFREEIVSFEWTVRGETRKLETDEHPKPQTTPEVLAKLKPVFKKDGVVTAGNASGIVDGAAALVVASESAAREMNLSPIGRMVAYGISGCDPKIMGYGPVPAVRAALKRAGLKLDDMDLIEVNEAFAPQALAVQRELGIPNEKFNVNGGAIAIGHPLAASGARITAHLLHELRRRKKKLGIGSACIGGGQGIALIVEAF